MDVNNLTLPEGYQMPFSLEAEQAVLGCVLMDPNCMPQVLIYLRPEYFYLPQHREIFSVMVSLDALGSKIDPLVILEALKNNGTYDEAAGKNYLFQLAQRLFKAGGSLIFLRHNECLTLNIFRPVMVTDSGQIANNAQW